MFGIEDDFWYAGIEKGKQENAELLKQAIKVIEFYATEFEEMPEMYNEYNAATGEEKPFGTKAREFLESLKEKK